MRVDGNRFEPGRRCGGGIEATDAEMDLRPDVTVGGLDGPERS